MEASVGGELGMEASAKDFALLDSDDFVFVNGESFDIGAEFGDDGSADENGFQGFIEAGEWEFGFEAMDLGTKGVPSDGDVEQVKGKLLTIFDFFGEHDHSHAGAPDWHSVFCAFGNGFIESDMLHEKADGCAFAAGDDKAVDFVEIGDSADFGDLVGRMAGADEGFDMFTEAPLYCEYADAI